MKQSDISRRSFISGTVGLAGSALAATPILLPASSAKAEAPREAGTVSGPSDECSTDRLEKASKGYKPRFPGPRWRLVYGAYLG